MGRLPNFVVIGGMRCGSTSLYSYLREHPEVFMSSEKETDYFSLGDLDHPIARIHIHRARTLEDYLRMFDGVRGEKAVGEASPSYLVYPRTAPRLRERIPDAKIICILRNPIDRAYSHFGLTRKMNTEPIPDFADAVAAESSRPASKHGILYAYTRVSLYADGLEQFTKRFPRDRIHVELFDDLAAAPAETMRRIYSFVDVRTDFVPDVTVRHNRSGRLENAALRHGFSRFPRIRRMLQRNVPARIATRLGDLVMQPQPPVPAELRAQLLPRFTEDISKLENLIGRDLSAWRTL